MILEYHRPQALEEALRLLEREHPKTLPLAGGASFAAGLRDDVAVVDLQLLGLDEIVETEKMIAVGAMARMTALAECELLAPRLRKAVIDEFARNMRNTATLGGLVVRCDGRSTVATTLLACDAMLTWLPGERKISLGEFLILRRNSPEKFLLTMVQIPKDCRIEIEAVRRTPKDRPFLLVCGCKWPSGRFRIAVGGFGDSPRLAVDSSQIEGVEYAVRSVLAQSGDSWTSAEYRMAVGSKLTEKLVASLEARP